MSINQSDIIGDCAKVVSSNTEITDRNELEERLRMLVELAPEWISSKQSLTGDMLCRLVMLLECIVEFRAVWQYSTMLFVMYSKLA